jgi:hypothetical protein
MSQEAIVVLTAKSIERILKEGGTSSWRLGKHARKCKYAVCTRNAYADWTEGPEAHQSAFLIGKVRQVVKSPDHEDRHLVQFSEYALVNIPDVWKGDRNPVKYSTLEELGIDPLALSWEPMPTIVESSTAVEEANSPASLPLTISEAKKGLALTFGVPPEAIEITIRG